jgi:hypothetical protein
LVKKDWKIERVKLKQFYTQQLSYQFPLFPGMPPDGDRMQFLKGMEIALVHCRLFVEKDLAHEVAIVAPDNVRIVLAHV